MSHESRQNHEEHVYHKGFPIPKDIQLSWFHRLTRTRFGLFVWVCIVIVVSSIPVIYLTLYVSIVGLLGIMGHRKLRTFSDWSIRSWMTFMTFLFEYYFGINVRIFGENIPFDRHCIIIMNHRCHLDWMYFWCAAAKLGNMSWWLVMLKNSLKAVPVIGWAMQYRNYIFLSRNWEKDEKELVWKLNYLKATGEPYQYLMFPEGTDLTPGHKKQSDKFARENNLPLFNYSLQPRSRGFNFSIKLLRENNLESIYDMTVGYPDVFAPTELEVFRDCAIPYEVHYHVKRYSISELPETDEEITDWLRKRWEEKEEKLQLFYTHRKFIEKQNVTSNGVNDFTNGSINNKNTVLSPEIKLGFPWLNLLEGGIFQLILSGGSLLWCWYSWYGVLAFVLSCVYHGYFCTYWPKMDYHIMNHFRKKCSEFLPKEVSNGCSNGSVRRVKKKHF